MGNLELENRLNQELEALRDRLNDHLNGKKRFTARSLIQLMTILNTVIILVRQLFREMDT
jgi:hypothetical protein